MTDQKEPPYPTGNGKPVAYRWRGIGEWLYGHIAPEGVRAQALYPTPAPAGEIERLSFAALREANVARQKEWDPDNKISLAYRGNELAGEVGEACNVLKKLEREQLGIVGSRATDEQLADELADVVVCVDLAAAARNIDLGDAIVRKFNATTDKHGFATRLDKARGARS